MADTEKAITFPRRSSPEGRETTNGGANLPEGNTSDNAPLVEFSIMYSLLIPIHIFSPHHDIDFTTSGTPNSFTSTNPRPPKTIQFRIHFKTKQKKIEHFQLKLTNYEKWNSCQLPSCLKIQTRFCLAKHKKPLRSSQE